MKAAREHGAQSPCLWGCLIRPVEGDDPEAHTFTLVSTRPWSCGPAAYQAFRPRWHIENDAYRELKEGWRLEAQLWGRDLPIHVARIALTCLAFNTAQTYLSRAGKTVAAHGIRRLRTFYWPQLGHSPVVIYIGRYYAVMPVEKLLEIVGFSVRRTLRPQLTHAHPP
jgi:hypothetical protein